ncbi:unnamed protein product, partial [Rangifer tarandus platyrhynchus]
MALPRVAQAWPDLHKRPGTNPSTDRALRVCVRPDAVSAATVQGQERLRPPRAGSSGVCAEGHLPAAENIRQTQCHQAGPSAAQRGQLRHADVTGPAPAWVPESQPTFCGTDAPIPAGYPPQAKSHLHPFHLLLSGAPGTGRPPHTTGLPVLQDMVRLPSALA